MRAIPGGPIAPENVVGRETLIRRLWRILDRQSLLLVAERRMGKTSVITKMCAEAQPGTKLIYTDVGALSSPLEFAERVLQDLFEHLSTAAKARARLERLSQALGGTQIGGLIRLPESAKSDWKTVLARILKDLAEQQEQQKLRVILAWDEIPWMLEKIGRSHGQAVVVDLLDLLRQQRQQHTTLRMLYTGSIGLHHVIDGLAESGYATAAVNDLDKVEVPPLDLADANMLAQALIRGEGLGGEQRLEAAERIATLVDGVAFYVHLVVARLAEQNLAACPELAERVVAEALTAAEDTFELEHYRRRLRQYYGERADLARAILDQLAEHGALHLGDLGERLRVRFHPQSDASRRIVEGDRDRLRTFVGLMHRDHYLRRDEDGSFGFRFPLVRRWWRLDLGLT